MLRTNAIITALIFCASCCDAQDINRAKQIIDTLCSTTFNGRGYIEQGDKKAAEFIATEFKNIGLKSFNNNFFQYFTFPVNTFPGELKLKIDNHQLEAGKDFIVDASSASTSGKAKLYNLDTLIFYDSLSSRDFLKVKCANSMLVYRQKDLVKVSKLPKKFQEKFYCFKQYIELQDKKLTASVSTEQSRSTTFQVISKSLPQKARKAEVEVDATLVEKYHTQNVIGFLTGNTYPDSAIMITAHYDHLGKMGPKIYFPGANDNASGISMLLELADYYHENPELTKYTLIFVAFAAEEAGLIGSHYYVNNPLFPLHSIKFLINLDLVGTGDDGITVVNGSIYNKEFDILSSLNNDKKYFSLIKRRGEASNSDHYFFHKNGVRSFFIYTLGGTTAYHDIYDSPSTLTFTGYSNLFKLLNEFIRRL